MAKKSFYKKKPHKLVKIWGHPKERDYILENLALLISSGIGITEAVTIVSSSLKSKKLQQILARVNEELDDGSPLWKALDDAKLLGENYINLIKVGEESGQLVDNLRMIVVQQQKERLFKEKVRLAMTYPTIVLVLMIVIGLGTAWFVLPKILAPFADMNVEIPPITKAMLGIANFFQHWGIIFVPAFVGTLSLVVYLLFYNHRLRFIGRAILMHTPGASEIIKQSEVARLGLVLGGLLESGIPVNEAIASLANTSAYNPYTKLYRHLAARVEEGYTFQKSFEEYKKADRLVPIAIQQMIFAGERSGNLAGVLGKIAEIYEEKVDMSTENLSIIVEPILLVVIGLGVLMIAIGVILPIYSLTASVGG